MSLITLIKAIYQHGVMANRIVITANWPALQYFCSWHAYRMDSNLSSFHFLFYTPLHKYCVLFRVIQWSGHNK